MSRKELLIITRYPVEFAASFGQLLLIIACLTLGSRMFQETGERSPTVGVPVYGFVLFLFVSDSLGTIGHATRREQKQGTLEQLYLSPASPLASLMSRITSVILWTGPLSLVGAILMSLILGQVPFYNPVGGALILLLSLSGTFGFGFAFAAVTLRIKETSQTLMNLLNYAYMIVCAPFFPFKALPEGLKAAAYLIPFSYTVDAFRSTLMGFPPGYPELASIEIELAIVAAFGLVMPVLGYWLYRHEEDRARRTGSLAEY